MKIIGEGMLMDTAEDAIRFALEREYLDSIVIGMLRMEEVDAACRLAENL